MKDKTHLFFGTQMLFNAFVVEFIGFFASGSIALLADSFFILAEFMLFILLIRGKKSPRLRMSGGLFLLIAGAWLANLAFLRIYAGSEVNGIVMLLFGLGGLLMTTSVARSTRKMYRKGRKFSICHVTKKTLPSILILAAGIWIAFTGEAFPDSLFALVISFLIILESVTILRGSVFKHVEIEE